jgi:hypothetical protein
MSEIVNFAGLVKFKKDTKVLGAHNIGKQWMLKNVLWAE